MRQFKIIHFRDYHEIDFYKTTFKHRFELGCFRPKTGYEYNRYYAIFYNRKPTKQQIKNSLNQLIQKNYDNQYFGKQVTNLEFDCRYP